MTTVLFNTLDLTLLITIYQCLLFAGFLLLVKKSQSKSRILLALFLLSHAAIPLDTLISFGEAFREFAINFSPNVFYIFGSAYWVESVLLLLYVRSVIYKDFTLRRADALYFLPVVGYLLYEINVWFLLDTQTQLAMLKGYQLEAEPFYTRFITLFRESFRVACCILCLIEIHRYQKQIKNEFANIEAIDLTWLRILVTGFTVLSITSLVIAIALIFSIDLNAHINVGLIGQASNFATMALISFLIFFSLNFSSLFKGIETPAVNEQANVKEEIAPELIEKLSLFMSEEKPYLNPLLSLNTLAKQSSISARQLSQLINRHYQLNFYEYINRYRVEECQRLLSNAQHKKLTMLEIMEMAGFNSKATFNTFFKKQVGCTPSQFKKQQLAEK